MDITGQIVLAYLEEDDSKRVLFRVRPLLTMYGILGAEDLDAYELDGYLRIAPDKGEQHTFKERMRGLGPICLINLKDTRQALGKIRPNKNYAPSKGETNRYIVYSDAVQPLPDDLLYEVISGDKGTSPCTRRYYLRSGGRISGPYCAATGPDCPASHSLPPDCDRLFLVELPDNSSRMFYWPESEMKVSNEAAPPHNDPPASPPAQENRTPEASGNFRKAASGLLKAMEDAGFLMTQARADQLLIMCLLSKHPQISARCLADARLAAETVASLFLDGTVMVEGGGGRQDDAVTVLHYAAGHGIAAEDEKRYENIPWPVFYATSGDSWPQQHPKGGARISKKMLLQGLLQEETSLNEETQTRLAALHQALEVKSEPLPLIIRREVGEWIKSGAQVIPGGQEKALDDALDCWAKPWLRFRGYTGSDLDEMMHDQ